MRRQINISVLKVMVLIMTGSSIQTMAQSDSTGVGLKADSVSAEVKMPAHSLFTGIGYGSNMVYLGTTISQDQPFEYGSLTYGFRNKFYLSLSAVHISNLNPFVAFYSGSANFTHEFNSWFDISAGITRYQVPESLTDTLFHSFTFCDFNFGIDWRIIYTRLSAGMLLAKENYAYFQVKNSRYFQTPEFTKKGLYFSFDPYVNLLFGSFTEYETISGTTVTSTPPFRNGKKDNLTQTSIKVTDSFGLLELDFGVPVAFNAPKLTIEVEAGYVLPLYEDSSYTSTKGFIVLVSAYFKIF